MKPRIAIIGAGLSGLACAFELEKQGITADIYEHRNEVEGRFINLEGMLDILYRPIVDSFGYLSDKYGLFLKPHNPIKRLKVSSENSTASVQGHMGYITIRGRHTHSLSKQLAEKLDSPIFFNSSKNYKELAYSYDIVVMATGDGRDTRELQKFSADASVKLLGMTITGSFDPYMVSGFLDNRLAPKGYVYQMAFDEETANLVIATPVNDADMQALKSRLLNHINFSGQIKDEFQITDYLIGRPDVNRLANTYFIGNCGGFIMPFLGFGQFGAILSGLQAGKAIAHNLDLEKEHGVYKNSYVYSLNLRRMLEHMENDDLDRIVGIMNSPLGKKALTESRYNVLKLGGRLAKPYATLSAISDK